MDIEARLKTVENDVREIREHVAKKDEVQWVECSAGEAFEALIAGKRVEMDVHGHWYAVRLVGGHQTAIEYKCGCHWMIPSNASDRKWRVPATEKKKRAALECFSDDVGDLFQKGKESNGLVMFHTDHRLNLKPGTKVKITIEEA